MAGKLILTTVGTSALMAEKLNMLHLSETYDDLRFDLPRLQPENLQRWLEGHPPLRKAEQFIEYYVDALLRLDIAEEVTRPPKSTNVFSAELTSLYLMGKSEDTELSLNPEIDTVILLLSESPEGALAGLINNRFLEQGDFLKGRSITPQMAIVPGLQVKKLPQFFKEGLKEFVRCIRRYAKAEPTKKALLNVTGGFKSLIPYTTYLSLAFKIPMVFVFEDLPHLIKIRPVILNPSTEQKERLLGITEIIRDIISEETGIPRDEFEL